MLDALPAPWRAALEEWATLHETGRLFCEECFDEWRHGDPDLITHELMPRAADRIARDDASLVTLDARGEALDVGGAGAIADALVANAQLTVQPKKNSRLR